MNEFTWSVSGMRCVLNRVVAVLRNSSRQRPPACCARAGAAHVAATTVSATAASRRGERRGSWGASGRRERRCREPAGAGAEGAGVGGAWGGRRRGGRRLRGRRGRGLGEFGEGTGAGVCWPGRTKVFGRLPACGIAAGPCAGVGCGVFTAPASPRHAARHRTLFICGSDSNPTPLSTRAPGSR
jgi:hypothetical protein